MLLPDGGTRLTRFLDARDVGRLLAVWIERGWPRRAVYNVAQPEVVPVREVIARIAAAAGRTPEWIEAPWEQIEAAGLPRAISPWAGSWVSVLDPGRLAADWDFEATSIDRWLPRVVADALAHRPAGSHPGYVHRAAELDFAARRRSRPAEVPVRIARSRPGERSV